MAQTKVRNAQGMAISFQSSQLVNLRATTEGQLIQVFRSISKGAIYEQKPLALIQSKLSSEHRQLNILKAVMISPSYWDVLTAIVPPEVTKSINVYSLTSDFLLTGDRFNRVLSRLSPRQDRKDKSFVVLYRHTLDGGVGLVDVGVPYIANTLDVTGAAAVQDTDPALGTITFDVGDVGTLIDVAFVTASVFNVVRVVRTHEQPLDHNGDVHHPYAYVMHPALAALLGITLPLV